MNWLRWWALGSLVLGHTIRAQSPAGANDSRFTVTKSIEMTTFSDPYTRDPEATAKVSPDGRFFVVVTTRGILRTNQLESSLWIFSSAQLKSYLDAPHSMAPHPQLLFKTASVPEALQINSYGSLITHVQWSSDSRSLLALVEGRHGHRHIYRIAVSAPGPAIDLTPGNSVDVEDFSESAKTIAYLVDAPVPFHPGDPLGEPINRSASVISGVTFDHFLEPEKFPDRSTVGLHLVLWVNRNGKRTRVGGANAGYFPTGATGLRIAVSPDGKHLISARPAAAIPLSWASYETSLSIFRLTPENFLDADRSGVSRTWPWQYTMVDLDRNVSRPLLSAPSSLLSGGGDAFEAEWSKDGKKILVTGTYLPISESLSPDSPDSREPCAAALYDIADRHANCIAASRSPKKGEYLRTARFGATEDKVELRWLKDGQEYREIYKEIGDGWSLDASGVDAAPVRGLTLTLRQDLNIPPVLWATDTLSGEGKALWDPNPPLKGIVFGAASVYRWSDASGYQWRAGLVLPVNYVPGQRYPLVIQTHGFYSEHEFLADGSFTTGFAAQPMAAAGMAVLQMEDRSDRYAYPLQQEASLEVAGFESAINHLNADGLIDPDRIGIIGFSRSHWYVEEALIHCPHCYRAATLIDGIDQSYVSDMLFAPHTTLSAKEHEAANGDKPYGPGLEQWIKRAPGFNLDKIEAPIRIEAIGKLSMMGEWELYSSLTQQNKPVDVIYIPDGQHILQKPEDRYASQQGNVDWFRFWLLGDRNTGQEQENRRWERLRAQESEHSDKNAEPGNPGR